MSRFEMPLYDHNSRKIILASQSPRRIELLKKIVTEFEVHPSHIDETIHLDDPALFVRDISTQKVMAINTQYDDSIIIGADSIVVLQNRILGKPENHQQAIDMLNFLSGNTHEVYTGIAILDQRSGELTVDHEITKVTFRILTRDEITRYIDVARPFDKAGAYGIQDESAAFVERIEGCFYNVMGLPVAKLYTSLRRFLMN